MANQVGPDIVSGAAPQSGQPSGSEPTAGSPARSQPGTVADPGHASYHGRTSSWVAVALIVAGFLAGGLALVFGPTWPVFWVGAGLAVIGGLLALMTDIFEDWY
ncbi:MAG TPA: HGxxPAAW family protein [Streptosporangiaceae bacterium]|nr:HGxxPAAW family protein [Streptosporangiaceae bacterium]